MTLQVINFTCDKDAPSVIELMADIPTPLELNYDSDVWELENLKYIDERLLKFVSAWGRPYGFIQEQGGAIVQNLFPIRKNENDQISSSSKATLEMHTETAFHPWRPHYIVLLCLRGDDSAGTTYALLEDIMNALPDGFPEILHQPMFETTLDQSFQSDKQKNATIRTPVLFNNSSSMTYDRVLMRGLNNDAQRALDELSKAIERVKQTFHLSAGQVAIIENWRVVHGRTPFVPRYDGTDRWIKRVMVRRSMPPQIEISEIPNSDNYVVTTTF